MKQLKFHTMIHLGKQNRLRNISLAFLFILSTQCSTVDNKINESQQLNSKPFFYSTEDTASKFYKNLLKEYALFQNRNCNPSDTCFSIIVDYGMLKRDNVCINFSVSGKMNYLEIIKYKKAYNFKKNKTEISNISMNLIEANGIMQKNIVSFSKYFFGNRSSLYVPMSKEGNDIPLCAIKVMSTNSNILIIKNHFYIYSDTLFRSFFNSLNIDIELLGRNTNKH